MRSLRALTGLRAVASTALSEYAEVATRSLTTVPDLKSVLREKIPEQQVRDYGAKTRQRVRQNQNVWISCNEWGYLFMSCAANGDL